MTSQRRFTVLVCPEGEESGFVALVPYLPSCEGHGDTSEEAVADARTAIMAHISEITKAGQPIPEETGGPWCVTVEIEA
jgi:predicted RNase H-like HicB family nuclease